MNSPVFIQQRLDEKVTIDQNTGNVVWDGVSKLHQCITLLQLAYTFKHVTLSFRTQNTTCK